MEGKVYGYVRVSTKEQNEDRQLIALQAFPVSERNIYMDKLSRGDFHVSKEKDGQWKTLSARPDPPAGRLAACHKCGAVRRTVQHEYGGCICG